MITLDQLFNAAFGISVDEDGLDAEIRMHAFNVGYELFLNEFDGIFPEKRVKTLKFTAEAGGNSIKELGEDVGGNPYDDFFRPFDVHRTDEAETFYEPTDESVNRFSADKRWFCDLDKIHFLNYDAGEIFLVRYLPEFSHYPSDQSGATKVFLPMRARPIFYEFLVEMYNSVEQEPAQRGEPPMRLKNYFKDLYKVFEVNKPISFSN